MPNEPENIFASAEQKIARGRSHIEDLGRQFVAWRATMPHRLRVKRDLQTGQVVVVVLFEQEIPSVWDSIIGDAIHNIRSSLDHMAYAVVGWDGGAQDRNLYFPIRDTSEKFRKACKEMGAMSPWLREIFVASEAFGGGSGSLLLDLNKADIEDKHHAIRPVARATSHPPYTAHYPGGGFMRSEGNVHEGRGNGAILDKFPAGTRVEVEGEECSPQIFLRPGDRGNAFDRLSGFAEAAEAVLAEFKAAVAAHPKA